MKKKIRGGVKAFKEIKVLVKNLLFLTLNFLTGPWLMNLSDFLAKLVEGLMQKLY